MKKINFIFIIIISIISLYIAFFGNIEHTLYKYLIVFSIIPVMLIPYILKYLFKINIEDEIIFLYLIFIFLAYFLGTIVNLYDKIKIYDKLVHTFSGIMSSFLALIILIKTKNYKSRKIYFNTLFVILVSCTIGFMWETFEFTCDKIFSMDAQHVITTGVNDTMTDMIVAFLGSCMFSLFYLYEEKFKKNLIINKFISKIS